MTTYTLNKDQIQRQINALHGVLKAHRIQVSSKLPETCAEADAKCSAITNAVSDAQAAINVLEALQPNTQTPVMYQSRMRPAWKDDADWFAWETCSRESAEAYERTPLLHDWQYQVRRLYAEQAHGVKL